MIIDFEATDFQLITIGGKAVSLVADKVMRGGVFITIEKASLRYRLDGKNATAAIGHIWNKGDSILIRNANTARRLSMRRIGSTDAVIMVSYLQV